MPTTEIIVPSLKQDSQTRETFLATAPELLKPIWSADGILHASLGRMISEDNISVDDDFRMVVVLGKFLSLLLQSPFLSLNPQENEDI